MAAQAQLEVREYAQDYASAREAFGIAPNTDLFRGKLILAALLVVELTWLGFLAAIVVHFVS